MELNEIIIIAYALTGIIITICFLYLCANVLKLKNKIVLEKESPENSLKLYYKYLLFGDKVTAKIHLQNLVWQEVSELQTGYWSDVKDRAYKWSVVKAKYEILFKEVDASFPDMLEGPITKVKIS